MAPQTRRKSASPRVAILGWAMSPIGEHPGLSYLDLLVDVIRRAAADAGLGFRDVEGLYVTPDDFAARATPMLATRLPEFSGISTQTLALVACRGMTGALAIKMAAQDLRTGQAQLAAMDVGSKNAISAIRADRQI